MRERSWLHWILAALLVALAGLAVAFAAPSGSVKGTASPHGKVVVVTGDESQTVVLGDLADGEARTIAAGSHEVVVTRHGDRLDVTLDGEALAPKTLRVHRSARADTQVWIERDRDDESADEEIHRHKVRMKWVTADDGEKDGEPIEVRIESDEPGAEGERTVMVFVGDGGPGDVVAAPDIALVAPDTVVYRCPEDGTVLRMDRDKATQESYLCPVCGREMEKSSTPHVEFLRMAAPPAPPAPPVPPSPPAPPAPRE